MKETYRHGVELAELVVDDEGVEEPVLVTKHWSLMNDFDKIGEFSPRDLKFVNARTFEKDTSSPGPPSHGLNAEWNCPAGPQCQTELLSN